MDIELYAIALDIKRLASPFRAIHQSFHKPHQDIEPTWPSRIGL